MPANDSARINLRTSPEAKAMIERAAALMGTTVSAFMIQNAYEAAQKLVAEWDTINLLDRDRDAFLAALENCRPLGRIAIPFVAHRCQRSINFLLAHTTPSTPCLAQNFGLLGAMRLAAGRLTGNGFDITQNFGLPVSRQDSDFLAA